MTLNELKDLIEERRKELFKSLSYREREMVKLRSGTNDGYVYTEEEVAHIFKTTTEDVHAEVNRALEKLRLANSEPNMVDLVVPGAVIEVKVSSEPSNIANPSLSPTGIEVTVQLPEYFDEEFVTESLVELYRAMNDMHVAAGGKGLTVDGGQALIGTGAMEGVPR